MIAIVRVRGSVGVRGDVEETMRRLKLTRVNHVVVYPETNVIMGMVRKAKDYITWGKISPDTLKLLIEERGELIGGKKYRPGDPIDGMSEEEFIERASRDEIKVHDYFKPFRCHPPRKGWRHTKLPYKLGGALGERDDMDDLIRRMV